MRPWFSVFDLQHRLRQLAPDDQVFARLAWTWVQRHALVTLGLLVAGALVSPGALLVVALNVAVLGGVGVVRARRAARRLPGAQAQAMVTRHLPSVLAYGMVVAPGVAVFIALLGPLRTPAALMMLLFVNAHGLERAGTALLHYLGKQPPRERRRLREAVRLPQPLPGVGQPA
ncbi:hypothetical protein [Deinococcus arcticus]|uniref:Uncharacterized protein n=1 Tax=Deinococcus arcticus TaxID=2136176 RepID=A0A2T3W3X5_9DEIO|nr:hypothetical protein [Deinococcus arcticus]PTA66595.1 hypothetical protein C8263_16975 [Deinococcus arcticus]